MKITNEIKDFFKNTPYIAFATADKNANPNVIAI
jgi:predicted pyridoxine 5'-phosphate oxidase superfamily flavin-nucleotide-binding protein